MMLVKDLDPYMKRYKVVCGGKLLGSKYPSGYKKPWSGKPDRPLSEVRYKKQPPWMTMEVEEICSNNTIWVKERKMADYSRYKTETLRKMQNDAATRADQWGAGMRYGKLPSERAWEKAHDRYTAITKELERREKNE